MDTGCQVYSVFSVFRITGVSRIRTVACPGSGMWRVQDQDCGVSRIRTVIYPAADRRTDVADFSTQADVCG